MGWLWSSNPAPSPQENTTLNPPQSTPEPAKTTPHFSTPLTRDEIAERELQSFLNEIEANAKPTSTKYNRVPRPPPSTTSQKAVPSLAQENGEEPLADQLLPTTMSCRTAFDAAFYCNSFGGRFNDLYRYGTLRSCSESWNDFWFCMRTRGFGDEQKSKAIKEHYRKKEWVKYGKKEDVQEKGIGKGEMREGAGSSEDVWRSREKKVEPGTAFTAEYEEFRGSDEEWNKREQERRRGVIHGSIA